MSAPLVTVRVDLNVPLSRLVDVLTRLNEALPTKDQHTGYATIQRKRGPMVTADDGVLLIQEKEWSE